MVILGSGVTGITTAYKLVEAGSNVTIIEKEPQAGGLAGCSIRNDAIFDFGAHAFVHSET